MPVSPSKLAAAGRAAVLTETEPLPAPHRAWEAAAVCLALAAFAMLLYTLVPWSAVLYWAAEQQRDFQNAMALSLRAVRGGDPLAIFALCSATAAYGFVHALGPGHGKVLLGGAALASGATLRRMAVLTVLSSLAQAGSAILLVASTIFLFGWATRDMIDVTETWLAPLSALAIAGIGALLVLRGLRAWPRAACSKHQIASDGTCSCGHAHGPTLAEVKSLSSMKEAAAFIASIALRPCTGALFVLVISWRMDIFAVGCLAVLAMGLGTAAFNLLVTASGVMARGIAALPLESHAMRQFSSGIHIAGGALIMLMSIALAWTYFHSPLLR